VLIKYRIGFRECAVPDFTKYLKLNQIPYERGDLVSVLEIYEDNPHWENISMYIRNENLFCRPETEFNKDELKTAEWLRMRSQWRFGYPQPEAKYGYTTITYTKDNYCNNCGSGLKQVDSFRIKKMPKWGTRNFLELNWVGDELFLSEKARQVLSEANISGIAFKEVKRNNGIDIHEGIEQLVISHILDKGLIDTDISIRKVSYCAKCDTTKYVTSGVGMLTFKKDIFDNAPDVVKSFEIFGDRLYATRVIIVNHKVYDTILKNKLGKNLAFEPIVLV